MIMEKKMETTGVHRGYEKITEKKVETTVVYGTFKAQGAG